jgi:hypothetical protein
MPVKMWKSQLDIEALQAVEMPIGAEILHAAGQSEPGRPSEGFPVIWYRCDPEAKYEKRWIAMCGTGHEVPSGGLYLGTAHLHNGRLVLHLFEVMPK